MREAETTGVGRKAASNQKFQKTEGKKLFNKLYQAEQCVLSQCVLSLCVKLPLKILSVT